MEALSNIAIVILNYNNYMLTINAIENINKLANDIILVVVDNCSPNESWEKLQEYNNSHQTKNLFLLRNPVNAGYACGNNFGIDFIRKHLDAKYVVIMNPDVEVRNAEMFYKMREVLDKNQKIGAITAQTIFNDKIYYPNDCCWKFSNRRQLLFGNSFIGRIFKLSDLYKNHHIKDGFAYVDVVQGCFFMTKLSTLNLVDDFDPNTFLYCEEAILAKRFLNNGYKNALLPDFYIEHNHIVKNKSLMNYKSKKFDMKCFYNSKKYYIKKYSGFGPLFKAFACMKLSFDYVIKTIALRFKLK